MRTSNTGAGGKLFYFVCHTIFILAIVKKTNTLGVISRTLKKYAFRFNVTKHHEVKYNIIIIRNNYLNKYVESNLF